MQWQKKAGEKVASAPVELEPSTASGPTAIDEDTLVEQQELHHPVSRVEVVNVVEYRRFCWILFYHQLPMLAHLAL